MPELKLTKRAVASLPPAPEGKRVFHRDTETPGLGVRVTDNGTKTFAVYRKVQGRPQRIALGRFPAMTVEQARREAAKVNLAIADDRNPMAERRRLRRAATLGELFRIYRDDYLIALGKRTRMPESLFRCHLSRWEHRMLRDISRADIKSLHAGIGRAGSEVAANRVHQLLRAMLNWAIEEELLEGPNPATGIKRFWERARERFLHPDEMPRFFQALAEEPNGNFRDFVLLALFTGARKSNVLAMRWADMHLARATWTIPETKTGEPHSLPLVPEALTILHSRAKSSQSEWVFPGAGASGHLIEPKRAWTALLVRSGINDLNIHDLRRTLGSWQAATGASLPVIGRTLAHKSPAATAIYARLDLDPVRNAVTIATQAMLSAAGLLERSDTTTAPPDRRATTDER